MKLSATMQRGESKLKQQSIGGAVKAGSLFVLSTFVLSTTALSTTVQSAAAKESPKREGFNDPMILSGLKHLKVLVAKLDPYATEHGESEDHIKQLLTEGLAPTHIAIDDGDSDSSKSGAANNSKDCGPSDTPLMYLKVKVIPDGGASKGAAFSVSLALVEKAKLTRNQKNLMVSSWTKETVGRLGDNVKEAIDQQVGGVLKDFHRDYLLANSADSSKDLPEENHGKTSKKHKSPR
jgi:hypothetical protein